MFAFQKVANQSKFIVLNGTIWYYSFNDEQCKGVWTTQRSGTELLL